MCSVVLLYNSVPWTCFDLCFDLTRLDFDQQRSRELLLRDVQPSANALEDNEIAKCKWCWGCWSVTRLDSGPPFYPLACHATYLASKHNVRSATVFVFVWACACRCVSCIISFYGTLYDTFCWTMTLNVPLPTIPWLSCPLKIIVSNGMFLEWIIPQIHWVPAQALIPSNYHCTDSNPCVCKSAAIHSSARWTKWRVASSFLITERVDDKTN